MGITNKLSNSSSSTKMGSMIGAFGVAEKIANWFKMDIVNTTVILTGSGSGCSCRGCCGCCDGCCCGSG